MNRTSWRIEPERILGKRLVHEDLRERLLAAFLATPDATHQQAVTALETVQLLELNRCKGVPADLYHLEAEWARAVDLPDVVREVHEIVRIVVHEETGRLRHLG